MCADVRELDLMRNWGRGRSPAGAEDTLALLSALPLALRYSGASPGPSCHGKKMELLQGMG